MTKAICISQFLTPNIKNPKYSKMRYVFYTKIPRKDLTEEEYLRTNHSLLLRMNLKMKLFELVKFNYHYRSEQIIFFTGNLQEAIERGKQLYYNIWGAHEDIVLLCCHQNTIDN
ncbi:MAG: hypothetical protein BAJALOKI2v1_530023 [Promethearchaeota archaeon]|nr:MAG: hypothetical protein BAJALOKI2v1_530023 [Candidatus Lokiarchaeota archaeon]